MTPAQKTPPSNIEAEKAVIAGMLTSAETLDVMMTRLNQVCFFYSRHALIFQAITRLVSRNVPVDVITVYTELDSMGAAEEAGGLSYLQELMQSIYITDHYTAHSDTVYDKFLMRSLIKICNTAVHNAFLDEKPAKALLAEAEAEIFNLSQATIQGDFVHIRDIIGGVADYIEMIHDDKDGAHGDDVLSGYPDLDDLTTGFKPADYIVLAGATSSGKTAFALSLARNIAKKGKGVGIFSLEMSEEQLIMRVLSAESALDSNQIRKGHLSRYDRSGIQRAIPELAGMSLYIDDTPGQTIHTMRSKARRLIRKDPNVGMFIIDYLQLVNPVRTLNNREQEVREISNGIKAMARELKRPVLAVAQLSRKVETRSTKDYAPRLSDLRESGSIEQDADAVMFVYRPEYYKLPYIEIAGVRKDSTGVAEIILAKQRNGPTGSVYMHFDKKCTSFDMLDLDSVPDYNGKDVQDKEEQQMPWETGKKKGYGGY